MSFLHSDDSVVEVPPASAATPTDPTDPFLNPYRSGAPGSTQQKHSRSVTAPAEPPAASLPNSARHGFNSSTCSAAVPSRNALGDPADATVPTIIVSKHPNNPAAAAPPRALLSAPRTAAAKRPRPESPTTASNKLKATEAEHTSSGSASRANKMQPVNSARRATRGALSAVSAASKGHLNGNEEEDDEEIANGASTENVAESVLLCDPVSDDDGEGDAEEKALIAAAGAVVSSGARGGSNGITPHPWLVTDAFHVSLWYVLRYAGSALSASDLWACRALLSLTAAVPAVPLAAPAIETDATGSVIDGGTEVSNTQGLQSSAWTWTGSEESELLLRLVLRKPNGFTGRHLETRYGDWLHVQPTLRALTERRFLWWTSRMTSGTATDASEKAAANKRAEAASSLSSSFHRRGTSHDATELSSVVMLELYGGARVAQMVLQNGENTRCVGESAALTPTAEELVRVLQAVRGTELRLFLTALRHSSKAHANRNTSIEAGFSPLSNAVHQIATDNESGTDMGDAAVKPLGPARNNHDAKAADRRGGSSAEARYKNVSLGDNILYDAIPGRKQDMIRYFVERRYSLWVPSMQTDAATGDASAGGCTVKAPGRGLGVDGSIQSGLSTASSESGNEFQNGKGNCCQQQIGLRQISRTATAQSRKTNTASQNTASFLSVKRCFCDAEEEALVVAGCWDTHVGPVYAPHPGLKAHLVWMTEIFHVLTSNGGAGAVGQQGLKPLAATMTVAAPPTLLMQRPQLLLLLQSLRSTCQLRRQLATLSAVDASTATIARCQNHHTTIYTHSATANGRSRGGVSQETANTVFLNSVPHALLPRWFTAPVVAASAQATSTPSCSKIKIQLGREDSSDACLELQRIDHSMRSKKDELVDETICSMRFSHSPHVDEGGQERADFSSDVPPPVQLFGTTAMLQEYRSALYTHRILYEVTEGATSAAQRFRARNETFVSHMYTTVLSAIRAGVAAIKRHPLKPTASPAQVADAARFLPPASFLLCATTQQPQSPPLSLDAILYKRGNHAEHLLLFTPLFRWFACLELLYQVLQNVRRYADANECLRFLLHEPVYVLHHMPERSTLSSGWTAKEAAQVACTLSPVTYAFRYKTHKRGEWLSRLAQNLTHLKAYPEALAVVEEAQAGYHELADEIAARIKTTAPFAGTSNTTAASLCGVLTNTAYDESKLPAQVKRRGRMLRVLWPSSASSELASVASSGAPSPALYHAVWEYVRERYCRRQDRLALERSLAMLHRRVRQWTPLASHRQVTTRQLADIAVRRISGVRDSMDYMLWREPSESDRGFGSARGVMGSGAAGQPSCGGNDKSTRRPALPVELFVLEHFLQKWNQRQSDRVAVKPEKGVARKLQPVTDGSRCVTSVCAEGTNLTAAGSVGRGEWRGAHCEGQWIRCLAHALLWDCYWYYPAIPSLSPNLSGAAKDVDDGPCRSDSDLLWLSAFQDGPLDMTTPVNFLLRRRSLIEERLTQLERCSKEELLAWVAAHIKSDREVQEPCTSGSLKGTVNKEAHSTTSESREDSLLDAADSFANRREEDKEEREKGQAVTLEAPESNKKSVVKVDTASEVLLKAENEFLLLDSTPPSPPLSQSILSIPYGQPESELHGIDSKSDTAAKAHQKPSDPESVEASSSIPEAWKVPVGSLPLLDILQVLPLPPLWRLLRCLYLSPITEGIPLRFSGFPDLIFWHSSGQSSARTVDATRFNDAQAATLSTNNDASPPFRLMEVKSPSDTLSTKQISVNDVLHRCGFDVCVLRVEAVHDNGVPVSNKKLR